MKRSCASAVLFLAATLDVAAVCSVPQPRLVCAEYFNSQAVVTATLVAKKHVVPKDKMDWFVYTLQTKTVLRGTTPASFPIYEENSSGRATFGWKVGTTYLLFLWYSKEGGAWELDGCGNSAPLKQAAATLKQIQHIRTVHGGSIRGVTSTPALSEPLPGVMVVARGSNGKFTTTTNPAGEFMIHLPAGQYTVRAIRLGWSFEPDDFTYEDPAKIRIQNGGCAQVQLTGRKTRE